MPAFQPDPDKESAQEDLGWRVEPFPTEILSHLGGDALSIFNPAEALRRDASDYYQYEFGLSGDIEPKDEETLEAMRRTAQGLRDKTLPGMVNDPARQKEPEITPEEAGAKILRDAAESWKEPEETQSQDRLF